MAARAKAKERLVRQSHPFEPMITVKIQKSVVLTFELPGHQRSSSSRTGMVSDIHNEKWQLERDRNGVEQWLLEIDAANATETRNTFLELARQIDLAFSVTE